MGFDFDAPLHADAFAFTVLVAPVVVTFTVQEASTQQATLGKRVVGLRVTDSSGRRMGIGRALGRSVVKFAPWQLAHSAVFGLRADGDRAGLLVLAVLAQVLVLASTVATVIDPLHRAVHDHVAGTRVVADTHPDPVQTRSVSHAGH
jgi:uncharacterized RDD family membrane protein YckC